jgi:hypothetical protein
MVVIVPEVNGGHMFPWMEFEHGGSRFGGSEHSREYVSGNSAAVSMTATRKNVDRP